MKKTKPSKVTDKVQCLYHTKTQCICIRPVTTQEMLEKRIKNREALKKWNIHV